VADRHDILERAFGSAEWRESAGAFFHATGLSLFVVDLETRTAVFSAGRCGYCHLSLDAIVPGPSECYDAPPKPEGSKCHVTCRGGLTTYLSPIKVDGRTVAHLLLSGFVSSTRERRKLYEHLMGRGVREEAARLAVRSLPVMARREIESFARLAVSTARSAIVASVSTIPSAVSSTASDATAALLETGIAVAESLGDPHGMPPQLLEGALRLFDAEAGTIALSRAGGYVEVVASAGEGVRPAGIKLRLEGGAAARALETGRTAVVAGERAGDDARRVTVVAPLLADEVASGTLELRLPAGRAPGSNVVKRIERFARFSALAIENAQGRATGERALDDVKRADGLAAVLGSLTDASEITRRVLSAADESLTFDVAGLVVTSWGRDRAEVLLGGDTTGAEVSMLLGEAAGRDMSVQPLNMIAYHEGGGSLVDSKEVRESWTFMSTDLACGDHLVGFLFCASATGIRFDAQDNRLLEGLGKHAAIALERAELFVRIRDDFAKTVAALSSSIDAASHTSRGHSARVMEYAMLIGEELDLELEQIEQLRFAGLLHDVGMTGVTEEILLKPIQLTEDELARVRIHAELGATVVEQIEFLKDITPVILHHHERWDGSGYPVGLAGEAIPLLARILAVSDALDGLTSGTQRQAKMSFGAARAELRAKSGSVYDPAITGALFDALDRQALAGSTGLLAPRVSKGRQDLPA
jgi:HD-GYP domain-containing protein (c-di-GMP phosphodiesterase class II)